MYAASSRRHGQVALKVLHGHLALSERERRRFFEEVERMRRVRHPSLVTLVDAGSLPDGRPYLCMPPFRGVTVAARVEQGRLPKAVALRYFRGLAEAVATLHGAGLVHRDIKPENVLLDEAGERAILLDFGIAREMNALATTTTGTGGARGTPAYMAPERLFGVPASVATDVYELAVVLYVMLVGGLPWDEDTADGRLQPRRPAAAGVHLPSGLATVLMKALSTRPEARPASALAFADAAAQASDGAEDARPPTADLRPIDDLRAPAELAELLEEAFTPACGVVVASRYRLDRLLGKGGMGEVWAATHVVTKKTVALKFLRASLARHPGYRRRFVREARAASRVIHPNVVQIHDVVELDGGVPAMVMDFLDGESLADRLARERVLSLAETALVMLPVLSAVGAAHSRGIVHRDLKPANIFLARGNARMSVTLLDFGIAKVTSPDPAEGTATLTMDGAMLGTPFYMSPEQIYGEPDVDHRSDIWALGVILFECLSGCRPTQAKSIGQILKIITNREIVPIDRLAPHVPPPVAALIMSMLSLKRDDWPRSLAHVYERLAASCGVSAEGAARLTQQKRRRAGWWSAATASLLVGVIASGVFLGTKTVPPTGSVLARAERNLPATATPPLVAAETAHALALPPPAPLTKSSDPSPAKSMAARKRPSSRSGSPAPASGSGLDSWLDQR